MRQEWAEHNGVEWIGETLPKRQFPVGPMQLRNPVSGLLYGPEQPIRAEEVAIGPRGGRTPDVCAHLGDGAPQQCDGNGDGRNHAGQGRPARLSHAFR